MKHSITFLFFVLVTFGAMAQNITVKSFQPLPMDMTATSPEGKRVDQNGSVAALIKIKTAETGINFEGGALGIVDAKQLADEVWVWVPRAARKITVKHPKLGVLRDYRYPVEIKEGFTYEMVLEFEKVVEEEELTEQFLSFKITPPDAVLEVNDEVWPLAANGSVSRLKEFGTYTYRVSAENYHSDAGKVKLDDPKKPAVVTVELRPNFSNVTLEVDADAEIWVDGQPMGTRTWTGTLNAGTHQIECRQANHVASTIQKTITDQMDGQVIQLEKPRHIAGSLKVESTPDKASVFLDGELKGETPLLIDDIVVGQYDLWVVKAGQFTDHFEKVDIRDKETTQVKCKLEKTDGYAFVVNGAALIMKYVEGGTFMMGAQRKDPNGPNYDPEAANNEGPVHSVTVSSFYIGEIEVTRGLWRKVMENDSDLLFAYTRRTMNDKEKYDWDNYPVYGINFESAQKFVCKLNELTKMNFRLPTEAEWEYAARGGKKSKGYKYPGSNNLDSVGWYHDNRPKEYQHGKQKAPNELGLYDMAGNAAERCSDFMGYYSGESQTNPQGPETPPERWHNCTVLRGANCYAAGNRCRVSAREGRNDGIGAGVRLVLIFK